MLVIEVRRYVNRSGIDMVGEWLAGLEDLKARARIAARLDRLSLGSVRTPDRLGARISRVLRDVGEDMRAIDYLRDFKERTRSK